MNQEHNLDIPQPCWSIQGLHPVACWSESSSFTPSDLGGGSKALRVFPGFASTQSCRPSSPHLSCSSLKWCVPRSHPATQQQCSSGIWLLPSHINIDMLSKVRSCITRRPEGIQKKTVKTQRGCETDSLPGKPSCVTVTDAGRCNNSLHHEG